MTFPSSWSHAMFKTQCEAKAYKIKKMEPESQSKKQSLYLEQVRLMKTSLRQNCNCRIVWIWKCVWLCFNSAACLQITMPGSVCTCFCNNEFLFDNALSSGADGPRADWQSQSWQQCLSELGSKASHWTCLGSRLIGHSFWDWQGPVWLHEIQSKGFKIVFFFYVLVKSNQMW